MAKETISNIRIYETNNVEQFKTIGCNRKINKSLVKNLKLSVVENDLLAFNPILVNEKMEVIDGQHRLQVCKELNHTVYYIVKPETANKHDNTRNAIRDLNVNKKSWQNEDYFNFYVNQKEPMYVELKEFIAETKLPLMSAVTLFSNGKTSAFNFHRGRLEKDDTNWEFIKKALNATKISNECYNLYVIGALINLVNKRKKVYNDRDFNALVRRLEVSASMHFGSSSKYLDLFEGKMNIK